MAKTLTIAGSNFLPQYITNSAVIKEQLYNKSNALTMKISVKSGDTAPAQGSEIVFKDGSRFLFSGFITRVEPEEYGEGSFFVYTVEASDYAWIFNNKIARRAYSSKTLKYIVEDLLSEYLDSGYSFTTTNVQTGPTIESITFDHINLRRCFEKLSKLTGYVWYMDYERNLFFQSKLEEAAPEDITDSSDNFSDISISYDTSQIRNSVIVIGSDNGQQSATASVETFTADGETRSWQLEDKPSQVVSIKVDTVSKQFSLDLNERDTDVFVYSFSDMSFRQTESQTTLTTESIEITYYPRVPIIVQKQDNASIAFFATKDGGDGKYEYTLKEPSITSKEGALERATQELEEFADPLVTGIFTTRTGLLASGSSIFKAGQYLTVNLPTYGISTDTAFLIHEVQITVLETTSATEYEYSVRFGGKIVDVEKFIESLAADAEEVQDVEEIKTIFSASDTVETSDNAPTRTLYTPPFEVGPSGSPQAVVGLSEMG